LSCFSTAVAAAASWSQSSVLDVVVGGGKRFLPSGVRTNLELLDERRFRNGTVYLRYRGAKQ